MNQREDQKKSDHTSGCVFVAEGFPATGPEDESDQTHAVKFVLTFISAPLIPVVC